MLASGPTCANKMTVPDVLLQAHSAPLEMAFMTVGSFPQQYQGDAFAADARFVESRLADRLQDRQGNRAEWHTLQANTRTS